MKSSFALKLSLMLSVELIAYVVVLSILGFPLGKAMIFAILLLIFGRALIVIISFSIAWMKRASRPPEMQIGLGETLKMLALEFWATVYYFLFVLPLERWLGIREPSPEARQQGIPILLIHGFFCNGGYWRPLQRYLQQRGITNVFTLNLTPIFGDIDKMGEQVKRRVEYICALTGAPKVILVGHSMGGLVARTYFHRCGGDQRVAKIITLGSPHNGTELAKLIVGTNVRQMRPKNAWVNTLIEIETCLPRPIPLTSIYSYHDNIIAPQDSSLLPHAEKNIPVSGVGHLTMALSKSFQTLVYEELAKTAKGD